MQENQRGAATHPTAGRGQPKIEKMATLLAQIIVREIVENGYKPGDRLAPERQMLETYSVSRGTLREALRFLEIQGVLEIRTGPNGGPIVKEPSFQNLARSLALLMQLDGSTFRVVVNARQALEPMVIAQGALVITDEELDELERSLGRLDSSGYEADDYSQQNWEFHDAIARACGNPLLWVVVSSLHWMTERIVGDFPFTEERQREHRDAHAAILAALRLREPATASEAMRQHLSYFSQWLEEEKPDLLDAPIEWHQM